MVIEIKRNDPPKKKASKLFMAGYNDHLNDIDNRWSYLGEEKEEYLRGVERAMDEVETYRKNNLPRKRKPNGTFNRTEYQRLYMQAKREMKLAGVEDMTVKQWRDKNV